MESSVLGRKQRESRAEKDSASQQPSPELLIQGISAEAEARAAAMEGAARDYALSRLAAAESQAGVIRREAAEAAGRREEEIARDAEARLALERRKLELDSEEGFTRMVLARASKAFAAAAREPGYPDRIFAWLCEAAIGLGADAAEIEAPEAERGLLSSSFLEAAEAEVARLRGRALRLSLSTKVSGFSQGLVLTAEGGRMAFDSSAPTRLQRAESGMRAVIREALRAARETRREGKTP